jgi:DNA-binding PadR family transcriptional regulator
VSATRLLILGALRFLQPAHGYEIRREVESWNAEQWANIAYGSIYHALKKMAQEGLLETVNTERVGNRPARTTYAMTEHGEEEFERLLREYWWEPKPVINPLQAAVSVMDAMPREELLAALRHQADAARSMAEASKFAIQSPWIKKKPRHVVEHFRFAGIQAEATARWAEEAIARVERDELP